MNSAAFGHESKLKSLSPGILNSIKLQHLYFTQLICTTSVLYPTNLYKQSKKLWYYLLPSWKTDVTAIIMLYNSGVVCKGKFSYELSLIFTSSVVLHTFLVRFCLHQCELVSNTYS